MDNIGKGHWIFAGVFVVAFILLMIWSYRKDFRKLGGQYRRVWMILVGAGIIYAIIFFMNRLT